MRKFLLTLSIVLILFGVSSCKKETNKREELVVGLECAYQPFNWSENSKTSFNYAIDGTRKYADGYDIQIAKKIADELNMKLVVKQVSWDGLIDMTKNNMIDLIIAGMSATPDRLLDIDFTDKYYESEYVFLTTTSNKYSSIDGVSQLQGATLIGQNGTLYRNLVEGLEYQGIVTSGALTSTVPEIITKLEAGLIDGTILEKPVALGLVSGNKNLKMVEFSENDKITKILDEKEDGTVYLRDIVKEDLEVCIGIRKGRDELKEQINNILKTISTQERERLMQEAVERVAE